MRTTIALDPDAAAEVERLRRERSAGVSAVVNELIRCGLAAPPERVRFVQTVSPMGARMDVRNVAEVIETIDGPSRTVIW
jgi:hypothetical protein